MKIGFIGCGNMAQAMIGGIISSGLYNSEDILATDISEETILKAKEKYGITVIGTNSEVVKKADIIFLMIKPFYYESVICEVRDSADESKTFVSVTPGKSIEWMKGLFGKDVDIVRTMPNTPAMVGEGMTALCPCSGISEERLNAVIDIFESFGEAELIQENLFDAVTGVSGSSPAYVFMFIEAMADAAVAEGMPRDKAYKFAAQAVYGSAKMVLETGIHPGALKDMVCSPGGTTIKAVEALKENGFEGSVIKAVHESAAKSREMQA